MNLENLAEDFAALRADPEAWAEELAERGIWDATLVDEFEDNEAHRIEPFLYSDCRTPAGYVCRGCAASNCKLWRGYNIICNIELLCCDCAAKEEHEDISDIDEQGRTGGSAQIGSFVPAIPTEEGGEFWGYVSVPPNGCGWWYGLPIRQANMPPP